MQLKIKDLGGVFKKAFNEWLDKDPFRQSAVIAYYAIFSLPGLLVLIISIAGYFFGKDPVNQNLLAQISSTMGAATAEQIAQVLTKVSETKSTVGGSIIGVVILLLGATGVFVELQKSLNLIWQVKAVPQKKILSLLRARLFSFGLIMAIAFLLLISLVLSTALASVSEWLKGGSSEFMGIVFNWLNFIVSLAAIAVLFALIFKILPDAKIEWKHVWLGSVVTALLFSIGKTALAFYFGTAEPGSDYGAAGSIILILLWVSYSSMILFFGAEFTAAYANTFSKKVQPTEMAVAESPSAKQEASKT